MPSPGSQGTTCLDTCTHVHMCSFHTWRPAPLQDMFGEKRRLLGPGLGGACLGKEVWVGERPTFTSKKADPKVGHRQIHFRKAVLASCTVLSLCLSQARRMLWGEGRGGPGRARVRAPP